MNAGVARITLALAAARLQIPLTLFILMRRRLRWFIFHVRSKEMIKTPGLKGNEWGTDIRPITYIQYCEVAKNNRHCTTQASRLPFRTR